MAVGGIELAFLAECLYALPSSGTGMEVEAVFKGYDEVSLLEVHFVWLTSWAG